MPVTVQTEEKSNGCIAMEANMFMGLLKKVMLAVALSGAAVAAYANAIYTESGTNDYGESFTVTFDWNSTTYRIDNIISGSFTAFGVSDVPLGPVFGDQMIGEFNYTYIYAFSGGEVYNLNLFHTKTSLPTPGSYELWWGDLLSAQITQNGTFNSALFSPNQVQISPVPEPETYAMMLAGLGLLGVMARCRKQKLNA